MEGLIRRFDETTAPLMADAIWQRISTSLKLHGQLEETLLYPSLKDNPRTGEIILEGYQEHHVAIVLAAEAESLDCHEETWRPKIKVLIENIEHHIQELDPRI